MLLDKALAAVALAAGLTGLQPVSVTSPTGAPGRRTVAKPILRVSLDEIVRDQDRAYEAHAVGRHAVELSVGFDPKANLWAKFRQAGAVEARAVDSLAEWNDIELPNESYRAIYESGMLRLHPALDPRTTHTVVSVPQLISGVYNAAIHVLMGNIVEYAVVHEAGPVPASICLIRRDRGGRMWITYRTLDEMREIQWFVSVNGTLHGMRLEGRELVFYSKPAPQANTSFTAEIALDRL